MANITIRKEGWLRPVIDGAMPHHFTNQDIGQLFIRTRPCCGDYSYIPDAPIKTDLDIKKCSAEFLGVNKYGKLRFRSPCKLVVTFEENDGCWISVKEFINRFEGFRSQAQKK